MTKTDNDKILAEYEKRPWTKWYAKGVPADIEIPEKSIPQMVDEAVKKWGNKTGIVFYGRKIKHKEMHELSLKFATALHKLGVIKLRHICLEFRFRRLISRHM